MTSFHGILYGQVIVECDECAALLPATHQDKHAAWHKRSRPTVECLHCGGDHDISDCPDEVLE